MANLAVTKMCFCRVAMTAYMLGHPAWETMYLRLATPKKLLFTQAFKSKSSNSVQLLSFLLLLFRNVKLYQNQWHITNMFPKTSAVCYTDSQHFSSCKPWMGFYLRLRHTVQAWSWGALCIGVMLGTAVAPQAPWRATQRFGMDEVFEQSVVSASILPYTCCT